MSTKSTYEIDQDLAYVKSVVCIFIWAIVALCVILTPFLLLWKHLGILHLS